LDERNPVSVTGRYHIESLRRGEFAARVGQHMFAPREARPVAFILRFEHHK
jgi:hypothetical protein